MSNKDKRLLAAAEAARKAMAKQGYDVSAHAIASTYVSTSGSTEPNIDLSNVKPQSAGGAARAAKLSPERRKVLVPRACNLQFSQFHVAAKHPAMHMYRSHH